MDDDLWTVLLSRRYERYPNIRALLPDLPDESLQVRWNGAAGLTLLNQGKAFYTKARQRFSTHSTLALSDARVLDLGCVDVSLLSEDLQQVVLTLRRS